MRLHWLLWDGSAILAGWTPIIGVWLKAGKTQVLPGPTRLLRRQRPCRPWLYGTLNMKRCAYTEARQHPGPAQNQPSHDPVRRLSVRRAAVSGWATKGWATKKAGGRERAPCLGRTVERRRKQRLARLSKTPVRGGLPSFRFWPVPKDRPWGWQNLTPLGCRCQAQDGAQNEARGIASVPRACYIFSHPQNRVSEKLNGLILRGPSISVKHESISRVCFLYGCSNL